MIPVLAMDSIVLKKEDSGYKVLLITRGKEPIVIKG